MIQRLWIITKIRVDRALHVGSTRMDTVYLLSRAYGLYLSIGLILLAAIAYRIGGSPAQPIWYAPGLFSVSWANAQ